MDKLKEQNLNKIDRMALFEQNWDGYNAPSFSKKSIKKFKKIVKLLYVQPEIAPTGRNSLLLTYHFADDLELAFEIKGNQTDAVFVKDGKFIEKTIRGNEKYTCGVINQVVSSLMK